MEEEVDEEYEEEESLPPKKIVILADDLPMTVKTYSFLMAKTMSAL